VKVHIRWGPHGACGQELTLCGQPVELVKVTERLLEVSCMRCLDLADVPPEEGGRLSSAEYVRLQRASRGLPAGDPQGVERAGRRNAGRRSTAYESEER
jgi:hypothetical protein